MGGSVAEWISALAEAVTALTVVIGVIALRQTRTALRDSHKQLETAGKQLEIANEQQKTADDHLKEFRKRTSHDHERSRRQDAIQYCLIWTNSLSIASNSARQLADSIGLEACRRICKLEPLDLPANNLNLLKACFPTRDFSSLESATVSLNARECADLKFLLMKYLNTLETVLAAWRHESASSEIIEEEFQFLWEPEDNEMMLKDFRTALGTKYHPAIVLFEKHLRDKTESQKKAPALG